VYKDEWRGCLLTDLRMPDMDGLALQAELQKRRITLPVVILSAHGDVATTRNALKGGAVDFLEKPVSDEVLVDVLQNAIRIDAERHRESAQKAQAEALFDRLTPRERAVLGLLAEGLQHRDIALRLNISPRTVEVYKARMMEKLHCRMIAEVVRFGTRLAQT
jgi:FixJ family two-component response regulator